MDMEKVAKYFMVLRGLVTEHRLQEKPHTVWNMDETGMQLDVEICFGRERNQLSPYTVAQCHKWQSGDYYGDWRHKCCWWLSPTASDCQGKDEEITQ